MLFCWAAQHNRAARHATTTYRSRIHCQTIRSQLVGLSILKRLQISIPGIDYNFCGLATLLVVIYENLYGIGLHKWFFPLLSFSSLFVFVSLDMILPFSGVIQNLANFLYVFRMFNMMEDFEGESDVKIQQYEHQLCGKCAYSTDHSRAFSQYTIEWFRLEFFRQQRMLVWIFPNMNKISCRIIR